jgi:site-specific recombinase XerC
VAVALKEVMEATGLRLEHLDKVTLAELMLQEHLVAVAVLEA